MPNTPEPWSVTQDGALDTISYAKSMELFSNNNKITFSPTVLTLKQDSMEDYLPNPISLLPAQKTISPEKKKIADEDYNPDCEGLKKGKKSRQLENRNVVPNIVRLVLSFVQKQGKSSKLVQKLIKKRQLPQATLKRFYLFHKLVKGSIDNYVHEETLSQLVRLRPEHSHVYSPQEQQLYQAITRKLVLYFLEHEAANCVLTSKRMEQSKKQDHVMAIRGLIARLPHTLSQ